MKNIQSISNGILPKNLHQNSSESFNSIGTRFQSVNNVIQKKFEMENSTKYLMPLQMNRNSSMDTYGT
jgi:hypothetical protein